MASLASCIKKLNITAEDAARAKDLSKMYIEEGYNKDEADESAVADLTKEIRTERTNAVDQITKAGGIAPTRGQSAKPSFKPVTASKFHKAIGKAKETLPHGGSVHQYSEAEYADMTNYLSADGLIGFAIKSDGDLVSVFKSADSNVKGLLDTLMPKAIELGATKLDAFEGFLTKSYAKHGFVEVGRDTWDEQYKPEGWEEADGTPDVVYMELKGAKQAQPTQEEVNAEAEQSVKDSETIEWSLDDDQETGKTVTAYKLFKTKKKSPNQLFPLFVNSNQSVPVGTWVNAEMGALTDKGKVKSSIGPLAVRGGWHAGTKPVASHIGGKSKGAKAPDYRPQYHVWAEIQMRDDVDWQTEANKRATKKKDGTMNVGTAHITDQVPTGGYYKYKTNPNMTGEWMIGGEMKVVRILSDAEVTELNKDGPQDLPRREGEEVQFSLARDDDGISTRYPTSKKPVEDPIKQNLVVGLEAAKSEPKSFGKNAELVSSYSNSRPAPEGSTHSALAEFFIDHVKDNLLWLYDRVPADTRERSHLWYDGARNIADRWSEKYGIQDTAIAGVMASLSPQKDWFMNVSLAERVLDVFTNNQDTIWTPEMEDAANRIYYSDANKILHGNIRGKSLSNIENNVEAAAWIRAYDEAHHPRGHKIISPEGYFLDWAVSKVGKRKATGWGSLSEITKAVSVLRDPSMENISASMGSAHKVRNFYNNIISPNGKHGDVTIDTHAVGAGLIQPLSGKSKEVEQNLGGTGSAGSTVAGLSGTYPFFAEAYRRAAAERGILPRQMQSITWEAVRGLFTAGYKGQKKNTEFAKAAWEKYKAGDATLEETRSIIHEHAGGINEPDWIGSVGTMDESKPDSSYSEELSGTGTPRGEVSTGSGSGRETAAPTTPDTETVQGPQLRVENSLQGKAKTKFTKDQAVAAVAPMLENISDKLGVKVEILYSHELPESVQAAIPKGKRPKGFAIGDTATIVVDHLENTQDAQVTLAHELIGHVGVNNIIEDWSAVGDLYDSLREKGGKNFDAIRAEAIRRNPNASRETLIKEFIAIAAEQRAKDGVVGSFMRKVREMLKNALRALGFNPISMTNIDLILSRSEEFLAGPQEAGIGSLIPEWMTAYHGTPHVFDKFSLDAMGSGEGAQAYGWGMYFAGRKNIAEWYRDKLSEGSYDIYLNGDKMGFPKTPEEFIAREVAHIKRDPLVMSAIQDGSTTWDEVLTEIVGDAFRVTNAEFKAKGMSKLKDFDVDSVTIKAHGQLYQVDIPEDNELLDWDKKLSQQPEMVKSAIQKNVSKLNKLLPERLRASKIGKAGEPYPYDKYSDAPERLRKKFLDYDGGPTFAVDVTRDGKKVRLEFIGSAKIAKQGAQDWINEQESAFWNMDGKSLYEGVAKGNLSISTTKEERGASLFLGDLGIKGLRYLDNQSRTEGEGTHNYVIWDENAVTIEAVNDEQRQAEKQFSLDKDLPMDKASRMARAEEQGFDTSTVYYHANTGGIEGAGFDNDRLPASDPDRPFNGHWFGIAPSVQAAYRDGIDGNTITPVYLRLGKAAPHKVWREVARQVSGGTEVREHLLEMGYDHAVRGRDSFTREEVEKSLRDTGEFSYETSTGEKITMSWSENAVPVNDRNLVLSTQDKLTIRKFNNAQRDVEKITDKIVHNIGSVTKEEIAQLAQTLEPAQDTVKELETQYDEILNRAYKDAAEKAGTYTSLDMYSDSIGEVTGYTDVNDFMQQNPEIEDVAVFDPKNIRSVNAAFDPTETESDNILFSLDDEHGFDAPVEKLTGAAIRTFQDKFRPVLMTQKEIEKVRGDLPEVENTYLAEEAFYGKTEEDLRVLSEGSIKPLAEGLAKYEVEREELDEWLIANHAKERNAHIRKINREMPDGGSGMTDMEAERVLNMVTPSKRAQLNELADHVYGMLEYKRQLMRDGLQANEITDAWEGAYKNYVPLKGLATNEESSTGGNIGKGFDIRGKESLKAMGRRSTAESPTLHAIKDITETIIRSRKNDVGNVFLKMVENNPNPEYWEVFSDDNPAKTRGWVKGEVDEVSENMLDAKNDDGSKKYYATKKDGKTYFIHIKDQRLNRAMQNMGPEPMNIFTQTLGTMTRYLSAMSTSYNPEFLVSNVARDVQTAVFALMGEQDLRGGRAQGKKLVGKMLKDIPSAMRAIHASLRGKELTGSALEWQQSFDQFREDGAKTGWFDMKEIDQQASELNAMVSMARSGQVISNIKDLATGRATAKAGSIETGKSVISNLRVFKDGVKDFVENANTAVENAVRLSVYRHGIEAGLTRKKAASLAKNLTVNFNRKGEVGAVMNSLYMFSNASIQGSAVLLRAMKSKKVQAFSAGIVAAAYVLATINRMASDDDDDGVSWYDKVPNHVRERNIVIMKSVFGGSDDPADYWTIPLPYGFNIFYVLGDTAEAAKNSSYRGYGELGTHVAMSILGSFSPLGFESSDDAAKMAIKTATPTVGKPFAQLAVNENFYGGSIFKENFAFGVQLPDSALAKKNAKPHWEAVSSFVNEATGGSAFRKGFIDVSPDTLDHLFSFVTGGAGKFASLSAGYAEKTILGEEIEDREKPFYRKISGKVAQYGDQSRFYDRADEIKQLTAESATLRGKEKIKFRKEYSGQLRQASRLKTAEKQLRNLRKQIKEVELRNLSDKIKEKRIERFEKRIEVIVDRFNKNYDKANPSQ